jgi:hypothetical protein
MCGAPSASIGDPRRDASGHQLHLAIGSGRWSMRWNRSEAVPRTALHTKASCRTIAHNPIVPTRLECAVSYSMDVGDEKGSRGDRMSCTGRRFYARRYCSKCRACSDVGTAEHEFNGCHSGLFARKQRITNHRPSRDRMRLLRWREACGQRQRIRAASGIWFNCTRQHPSSKCQRCR